MSRERPLDEEDEDEDEDYDLHSAWAAGHIAYEEGRGENANIYEPGTAAWHEWRTGHYIAAQAARSRAH
jgi:hypothetical protein